MEGTEKMLLEQILDNQSKQSDKLDLVVNDINAMKLNLMDTKNSIIGQVEKDFVKKTEFPTMWKHESSCAKEETFKKANLATDLVTMLIRWGGWIVTAAGVIVYYSSQIPK